jgi:hypothetical protein
MVTPALSVMVVSIRFCSAAQPKAATTQSRVGYEDGIIMLSFVRVLGGEAASTLRRPVGRSFRVKDARW